VLVANPVMDGSADLTLRDLFEGLGWLIVDSQAGGASVKDQIMVMQSALDALLKAFP
jgi:hypothetical protein